MRVNNETKGYKINAAARTIELTKKFEKAASVYGSEEYRLLVALMNDFPTFTVVVKEIKRKEGKKSYKGLSIEEMRRFVTTLGAKDLATFNKVVEIAKQKKGSYALIKKWFLDNYKEAYEAEIETAKAEEAEIKRLEAELLAIENEVESEEASETEEVEEVEEYEAA